MWMLLVFLFLLKYTLVSIKCLRKKKNDMRKSGLMMGSINMRLLYIEFYLPAS